DGRGQRRLAHQRRLLAQAAPQAVPPENWFLNVPPPGEELASIIILCCNQREYTKGCLENVLRHTRVLYELVIVDNGSTDGTRQYLEELRGPRTGVRGQSEKATYPSPNDLDPSPSTRHPPPVCIEIIRN